MVKHGLSLLGSTSSSQSLGEEEEEGVVPLQSWTQAAGMDSLQVWTLKWMTKGTSMMAASSQDWDLNIVNLFEEKML